MHGRMKKIPSILIKTGWLLTINYLFKITGILKKKKQTGTLCAAGEETSQSENDGPFVFLHHLFFRGEEK
jgi:hypothetical protein